MMRGMIGIYRVKKVRRALPLALLALAAAPAGAQAAERVVDMPAKYFVPPNITTLAGDTVTWTNSDTVEHDVAQLGGGFDSGSHGARRPLLADLQPARPLRLPLHDPRVHGRHGRRLLVPAARPRPPDLDRPPGDAARHRARRDARGRIDRGPRQRDWAPVTAVAPAPDGSFRARGPADRPTVYRALADAGPSLPLPLKVGARLDTTVKRLQERPLRDPRHRAARPAGRARGAAAVLARALPLAPGRPRADRRDSRVTFKFRPPGATRRGS
jgi:hypothetical protein